MAFLTIDWISELLNSLLLTELALVTQNLPFLGIKFSHSRSLVLSNSSVNVSALNCPTLIKIRSVVLKLILARHMASESPTKVTFPSSTDDISYPRSYISLFNTDSRWQGAINSYVFIYPPKVHLYIY